MNLEGKEEGMIEITEMIETIDMIEDVQEVQVDMIEDMIQGRGKNHHLEEHQVEHQVDQVDDLLEILSVQLLLERLPINIISGQDQKEVRGKEQHLFQDQHGMMKKLIIWIMNGIMLKNQELQI